MELICGDFSVVYPEFLRKTGKAMRYDNSTFQVFYDQKLGIIPVIDPNGPGESIILDPRAIVFNESTACVEYSPRYFEKEHAEWVIEYLKDHPNWGQPGCEEDWNKSLSRTQ